jgi:hypothetical protein
MTAVSAARADNVVQQAPQPAAQPATTVVQPAPVQAAPATQAAPVVQQTNVNAGPEEERPSIISHGYKGLLAGALLGAGTGYLVGRREGWERSDWRAVGLGIGIGSLAGAGLGISLGIADRGESRGSRYIARDLLAGAGFGAVLGTIGGGISAAVKNDGEHVLAGASIGVLAGAGLGIITGIIEGRTNRGESSRVTTTSLRLRPDLTVARNEHGSTLVAPGVVGTF